MDKQEKQGVYFLSAVAGILGLFVVIASYIHQVNYTPPPPYGVVSPPQTSPPETVPSWNSAPSSPAPAVPSSTDSSGRSNDPPTPINLPKGTFSGSSYTHPIGMTFKRIEPGSFTMGSSDAALSMLRELYPSVNEEWIAREQPPHTVRISRPFYLAVHEVTVGQFRQFVAETDYKTDAERDGKGGWVWNGETGEVEQNPRINWLNPGFAQTDDHPVVQVSWNDAKAFADWMTKTDQDGFRYRLPTEAEWEYAARAGSSGLFGIGDDPEKLATIANVPDATFTKKYPKWLAIKANDGHAHTAPVGSLKANAWGLHDMIGNVWEWCADGFDAEYYAKSPLADPVGPSGASYRVIRGGSWAGNPGGCRPAFRSRGTPTSRSLILGFRLASVRE